MWDSYLERLYLLAIYHSTLIIVIINIQSFENALSKATLNGPQTVQERGVSR